MSATRETVAAAADLPLPVKGKDPSGPSRAHSVSTTTSNTEEEERVPLMAVRRDATPPTTLEEMEGQLENLAYTLGTLTNLQERGKYISEREVANLRKAYDFTVSEYERHVAASPGGGATPVPQGGEEAPAAAVGGQSPGAGAHRRSEAAARAQRTLLSLEAYVKASPLSSSHEATAQGFSWSSIIHTPSERRMQSAMISIFMFFTFIPVSLALTVWLLTNKYTAPFMILYLVGIFTFNKVQHPIKKNTKLCQHWIWHYYRDYFPTRLVVRESVRRQFDPSKNYFFAYHPHGVHGFGAIMNFGLDTNGFLDMCPGIMPHLQTLKINFFVPFWRRLSCWMGCGDASAKTIRRTLRSGPGESIVLVVGGAEESLMTRPNSNDLYLVKRKGFVKIALQEGAPLVPVYGFGENNAYRVPSFAANPHVKKAMRIIKKYTGFVPLMVVGRGFFNFRFGVLPHRRPIVVVVGEPINVPRIENPTAEELEYWQNKYIAALEKLYEENRNIYDLESTGLRIMN